jgi:hypothetical protein
LPLRQKGCSGLETHVGPQARLAREMEALDCRRPR